MATVSMGDCYLCGARLTSAGMNAHLIEAHGCPRGDQRSVLLRMEAAYDARYWLYADVSIPAALSSVDTFLRKIWLECCGHMSGFRAPGEPEIAKSRKLGTFSAGDRLVHDYDYGATTETLITVVAEIARPAQRDTLRLLARNVPPDQRCAVCGRPATAQCAECAGELANPFLCDDCSARHAHADMLLPVTNSPRSGECGYRGELDRYAFDPAQIAPPVRRRQANSM